MLSQSNLELLAANQRFYDFFRLNNHSKYIGLIISDCLNFIQPADKIFRLSNSDFFVVSTLMKLGDNEKEISFEITKISQDYLLVNAKDVTVRNLLETKETYEAIYHQLPDGIINHSDGIIITCNNTFLSHNDDTKSEIKGKPFISLFSADDHEKILDHIRNPVKGSFLIVSRLLKNGKWHKYILESFVTKYFNKEVITSIVSDYQLQEDLAKEQLRANLASEANVLLEKEIEKHKETQRKLEASQEISKSVFNSSIDTIISSGLDDEITEISPSACYTFGYEAKEFLSLKTENLFSTKYEFDKVSNSLKKDGFFIGEVENIRKDGSKFTCFLSCAVMRNKKGEHIGYMGISRDITDIKKAEEELINSEKRYRDLFVNLSDALVIVDQENRIIDLNTAAKTLFGDENSIYLKKHLFDFVHPDDYEQVRRLSNDYRKNPDHIVNVEFRIIGLDKQLKYVSLSSTAIFEEGIFIGSRDIIRDVTQEKEYQELIKNKNSHLTSIFENKSDVIMFTLDHRFKLTSFNSKLADFLLYHVNREIKIGDDFMEILLANVSPKVVDGILSLYTQTTFGEPTQFEGVLRSVKGENVWLETFLSPIKVEGRDRYDLAAMAMDITNKKQIEIEITKSLEEKEVLLKEVHHRVKNNLQVISSILNLQSSYVKDANTLEILRESQNRVKSMSFIHESLYRSSDFSQVNFSDYLNNLINNVVHSFMLPERDVMLVTDLGSVNLTLDQAIPCGLIINELLTNAMKYAFEGIKEPVLEVKISEENEIINLWVIDNGIGLPEDFKMEETDSLGLQLVQTLTEQLEGTLKFKTDKGTKYLLTFEKLKQVK